ncbi:prolyl 4-hydroxylase subunit alpha-1-like [Drosophila takahashii]|uniref:prolyl 4-hydroxylase subunit alpha-1-like n=1 Tax=Drosophila takahashii TaxID=29030 RepID=UPI001CF92D02|nr:prolyl 4-hydroxylase subunit alpha-1-like [Drosophila takahashii]
MDCKWKKLPGYILILQVIFAAVHGNSKAQPNHALSVASMPPLLDLENKLIDNLEDYANELEQKLQTLQGYVPVMRSENEKGKLNAISYLSNPLNSFSLIRRLQQDWLKWQSYMVQPVGTVQMRNFDGWWKDLPKKADLGDACAAIVRIQIIYDLKVEDIIRGKLDGRQYNVSLSTADIFAIGQHLAKGKAQAEAILWLQEVQNRLQEDLFAVPDHLTIKEIEVLKLLAECHAHKKNYSKALSLLEKCLMLNPHDAELLRLCDETKELVEIHQNITLEKPKKPEDPLGVAFTLACRGVAKVSGRLHCFYNCNTTSFLRLAPLKVEEVGLDPYVLLHHEVITPKESKELKELALSNLRASGVFRVEGAAFKRMRTVKSRWIHKDFNKMTKGITRRIRDITGLDLTTSEKFQIINYGMGGHYNMHKDYFNYTNVDNTKISMAEQLGDRIATVLFYLSDVEQGGATVFPKSGYTIYPRAGTAIFWYNLHTDGLGDPSTLHAACPVIVGSKWVMTEWIRELSQLFVRPCFKPST